MQLPFEFYNTVWGKIYKKSIILNNNIRFDNCISRGEDTLFIYMIALCIDIVVHSRDKFVNYRIRSGSLMRSAITNVPSLFIQSLAKYKKLLCFIKKHNVEEIALSSKLKWHAAYLVICDFNRSVSNFSEFRLNLELLLQEKSLCYCVQQNKREYPLSKEQIKAAINALPIQKTPGVGMVFIAQFLDKSNNRGTYEVVFFNTETKEIIEEWITDGKARGFGLRNYWAGSIYSALKKL